MKSNVMVTVILVIFLSGGISIYTGCAHKKDIPADDIRNRADRAFDDLESVEGLPGGPDIDESISSQSPESAVDVDSSGQVPQWVNTPWKMYPSDNWLTGVGLGDDRRSAEDRARSEIAKIFRADIDSRTKVYQSYFGTSEDNEYQAREQMGIDDVTRVSTRKVLSGIRIAEVFREDDSGAVYYALAVLHRGRTSKVLQGKINSLDQQISQIVAAARESEDRLVKIRKLKSALQTHVLREAYDAELRIVGTSGSGIEPSVPFSEIRGMLTDILMKDFFVAVSVGGSNASDITGALRQGLTSEGFSITDNHRQARIIVEGDIDIHPLERGTGQWEYVRWHSRFDLTDKDSGAVIGTIADSGREGHLTTAQANERAVRTINNVVVPRVSREITGYIFRQNQDW